MYLLLIVWWLGLWFFLADWVTDIAYDLWQVGHQSSAEILCLEDLAHHAVTLEKEQLLVFSECKGLSCVMDSHREWSTVSPQVWVSVDEGRTCNLAVQLMFTVVGIGNGMSISTITAASANCYVTVAWLKVTEEKLADSAKPKHSERFQVIVLLLLTLFPVSRCLLNKWWWCNVSYWVPMHPRKSLKVLECFP